MIGLQSFTWEYTTNSLKIFSRTTRVHRGEIDMYKYVYIVSRSRFKFVHSMSNGVRVGQQEQLNFFFFTQNHPYIEENYLKMICRIRIKRVQCVKLIRKQRAFTLMTPGSKLEPQQELKIYLYIGIFRKTKKTFVSRTTMVQCFFFKLIRKHPYVVSSSYHDHGLDGTHGERNAASCLKLHFMDLIYSLQFIQILITTPLITRIIKFKVKYQKFVNIEL